MEKTISREEFNKIEVGDYITIISKTPDKPVRLSWVSDMDAVLGKTCKVIDISYYNLDSTGDVSAVYIEDSDYSFSEQMITKVTKAIKAKKEEKNMMNKSNFIYAINKVIYHNPATIVLWADGTKTTAKVVANETYDPEKGLLLCALKKLSGTDEVMDLLRFAELADKGTVTHQDVRNMKKKELRKSKKLSKNS